MVKVSSNVESSNKFNRYPGDKDDLYQELWHACAGPFVYVPRIGDTIVYFPQGHIEQVEAFMDQDLKMEMPIYDLPSKIFCRVVNVQLKAEAGTDEVFAQITLIPEIKQNVLSIKEVENCQPVSPRTYLQSFTKKLTSSDTSTHGGCSVHKQHAEKCLPPMDMSGEPPEQKLLAKDLHGFEWCFRHVFRGQPKRHLLTTGWSTFVTKKKLLPGDAFIFLRGENGELRVGVRRAMKLQTNALTSIISGHSMQHGILATAFHAIITRTPFTIYYRPWTGTTGFVIPFDQYLESAEIDFSVGSKFSMLFEGEECAEQRIKRSEGTVIGIEDVNSIHWRNSEWRSVKVKWDATPEGFARPDRVSPWQIEPVEPRKKHTSPLNPSKRACTIDMPLTGYSGIGMDGSLYRPVDYATSNHLGVSQGQEKRDTDVQGFSASKLPMLPCLIPENPDSNNRQLGLGNQQRFSAQGPFHLCPDGTTLISGGKVTRLSLPNSCCHPLCSYEILGNAVRSGNLSVLNVNYCNSGSQNGKTSEPRIANETPNAPPNGGGWCRIFGVNFVRNPPELPSPQIVTSSNHESLSSVPQMSHSCVSESSKSASAADSGSRCRVCWSDTDISGSKVLKSGAAGRSVDLTKFDGYDELKRALDKLFDFKGSLIDGSSGWQVIYDDEGDMMLVGDCPWKKFQARVRKMFICQKEDIAKLNMPSSRNRMPM